MANGFGSAAGAISNLFASGVGSTQVDPAFGMAKAIEQKQRDEMLFAQYGLFSPIGVLKNVMGYGDDPEATEKIKKWREWSVNNIEQMPVATAYSLFGSLYPQLLQHVQQKEQYKISLLSRIGQTGEEDKANMSVFKGDWDKAQKKYIDMLAKNPYEGVKKAISDESSKIYGKTNLKDIDQINTAFWTAYDMWARLTSKGVTTDEERQQLAKLEGLLSTMSEYVRNKAYHYYFGDQPGSSKDVATYSSLLDLSAGMNAAVDFAIKNPSGTFPFPGTKKDWYSPKYNVGLQRAINIGKNSRNDLMKLYATGATDKTEMNYGLLADQYGMGGALKAIVDITGDSALGQTFGNVIEGITADYIFGGMLPEQVQQEYLLNLDRKAKDEQRAAQDTGLQTFDGGVSAVFPGGTSGSGTAKP